MSDIAALIGGVVLFFAVAFGAIAYTEGEREQSFRVCIEAGNTTQECDR